MSEIKNKKIMVSACLCGINCRYDGQLLSNEVIIKLLRENFCIPVCPEQLGGLSTPRTPSYISEGDGLDVIAGNAKVVTFEGKDVTNNFIQGAQQVVKIAKLMGCTHVILKEKSPSCGVHTIYHQKQLIKGCGVTTALLLKQGFSITADQEIN